MEKRLAFVFGDLGHVKLGGADSFTDQLSCKYSVLLLTLFVVVTTTRVYVGEPISCYVPASWSGSDVDYVEKLCWVSDTFSLPEDQLPARGQAEGKRVNYYQWVTLLMVGQAFLFYLPRPVWQMLNKKSGVPVSSITDAAIECYRKSDAALTSKNLKSMTIHLSRLLSHINHKKSERSTCGLGLRRNGNYLVTAYIFTKMLYLANAIGQLFLLGNFLNTDYHLYGFEVVRKLAAGIPVTSSERFPTITLCHFNLKTLGNIQRYTVQCALPLNFFYGVIFIVLWFWLVLVAVLTSCSLVWWVASALTFRCHVDVIRSALIDMGRVTAESSNDVTDRFVRDFLKRDGCFILRLVGKNTSDVLKTELICCLWDLYLEKQEKRSLSQKIAALMDTRFTGGRLTRGRSENVATAPSYEAGSERSRNKSGTSGLYVLADPSKAGQRTHNGCMEEEITIEMKGQSIQPNY